MEKYEISGYSMCVLNLIHLKVKDYIKEEKFIYTHKNCIYACMGESCLNLCYKNTVKFKNIRSIGLKTASDIRESI